MDDLNLRAQIEITGTKDKKTQMEVFKDTKVGDILSLVITLRRTTSRRGNYATYINILNRRTDALTVKSQSEIMSVLERCFEFKQI